MAHDSQPLVTTLALGCSSPSRKPCAERTSSFQRHKRTFQCGLLSAAHSSDHDRTHSSLETKPSEKAFCDWSSLNRDGVRAFLTSVWFWIGFNLVFRVECDGVRVGG